MVRLFSAALAVCLLGSSAAVALPAVPPDYGAPRREPAERSGTGILKLADLAGAKLSAVDGSTFTLAPMEGGLAREIAVPDGRVKKTLFVLLNDRLGTVSEGRNVAGLFRVTDTA